MAQPKKNSAEDFVFRVQKKLGKKAQSSVEIARKLGYIDEKGDVKPYGAAKVRKALQQLAHTNLAVQEGQFRTSKYRLP